MEVEKNSLKKTAAANASAPDMFSTAVIKL